MRNQHKRWLTFAKHKSAHHRTGARLASICILLSKPQSRPEKIENWSIASDLWNCAAIRDGSIEVLLIIKGSAAFARVDVEVLCERVEAAVRALPVAINCVA